MPGDPDRGTEIVSKFDGVCAITGEHITKGERVCYAKGLGAWKLRLGDNFFAAMAEHTGHEVVSPQGRRYIRQRAYRPESEPSPVPNSTAPSARPSEASRPDKSLDAPINPGYDGTIRVYMRRIATGPSSSDFIEEHVSCRDRDLTEAERDAVDAHLAYRFSATRSDGRPR
jgi:hypothetical protein